MIPVKRKCILFMINLRTFNEPTGCSVDKVCYKYIIKFRVSVFLSWDILYSQALKVLDIFVAWCRTGYNRRYVTFDRSNHYIL